MAAIYEPSFPLSPSHAGQIVLFVTKVGKNDPTKRLKEIWDVFGAHPMFHAFRPIAPRSYYLTYSVSSIMYILHGQPCKRWIETDSEFIASYSSSREPDDYDTWLALDKFFLSRGMPSWSVSARWPKRRKRAPKLFVSPAIMRKGDVRELLSILCGGEVSVRTSLYAPTVTAHVVNPFETLDELKKRLEGAKERLTNGVELTIKDIPQQKRINVSFEDGRMRYAFLIVPSKLNVPKQGSVKTLFLLFTNPRPTALPLLDYLVEALNLS